MLFEEQHAEFADALPRQLQTSITEEACCFWDEHYF